MKDEKKNKKIKLNVVRCCRPFCPAVPPARSCVNDVADLQVICLSPPVWFPVPPSSPAWRFAVAMVTRSGKLSKVQPNLISSFTHNIVLFCDAFVRQKRRIWRRWNTIHQQCCISRITQVCACGRHHGTDAERNLRRAPKGGKTPARCQLSNANIPFKASPCRGGCCPSLCSPRRPSWTGPLNEGHALGQPPNASHSPCLLCKLLQEPTCPSHFVFLSCCACARVRVCVCLSGRYFC